ncbi:MAG: ribonuclease P protein component [Ideonella sp.]|nr:ribonuclease P protein component [Ideonella sp.]
MIGRIVRPADFERVLSAHQRSKSTHFAVHYLAGVPSRAGPVAAKAADSPVFPPLSTELSTGELPVSAPVVDDAGQWLGLVVPKRHAKRAVTRTLIKRQVRAAMALHASQLPAGLWVVRVRAPFDRQQFPSAASAALSTLAREELATLFHRAAHSPLPPSSGRKPWGGRGKAKAAPVGAPTDVAAP